MDELSSINHELMAMIKPKINQTDSSFDLWFDGFELLAINEHVAKFSTPSMLKKSVITTKYKSLIAEEMEEMKRVRNKLMVMHWKARRNRPYPI